MKTRQKFSVYLLLIFVVISFYSFGTAMMDYFMVYPSRYLVGDAEFVSFHKLLEKAIWPISVVPFLIIIILNILLVWFRPTGASKRLIFVSLICLALDFISTVFLQAPWNYQLLWEGKNVELMQKITDTNWVRVVLETVQVMIGFLLLRNFIFEHLKGSNVQSLNS